MHVIVARMLTMILILSKMSRHDDFIFWDEMWNLTGDTSNEIIELKDWQKTIIEQIEKEDEK